MCQGDNFDAGDYLMFDFVSVRVTYNTTLPCNSGNSQSMTNDTWTSMTGTTNWSNVTKVVNSTSGSTIKWCIYANDTSNNWNGTSCINPFSYLTTGGINDATWSLGVPNGFVLVAITGTTEGSATDTINWTSCNFTNLNQNWIEPLINGTSSMNQSTANHRPIFYIDNTGTGAENFAIRLSANLPSGINITANASCSGTYTSCQATPQNITTSYTTLVNGLSQTSSFANITFFCGVSGTASAGQSGGISLIINGSLT